MPNQNIVNPHLAMPFRFNMGSAVCVEQDSDEDVEQSVINLMRTPQGFRLEIPGFGVPNVVLEENGPLIPEIEAAINAWEPRAAYTLTVKRLEDILSSLVELKVGARPDA